MGSPDEAAAAYAFWKLVEHLQMRTDVQNIEQMILSGFCRNCLSKWYHVGASRAGLTLGYEAACEHVYGMPYGDWKKAHQSKASDDQLRRLEETKAGHARHEAPPAVRPVAEVLTSASPLQPESQQPPQPQPPSPEPPLKPPLQPSMQAGQLSDVCCVPAGDVVGWSLSGDMWCLTGWLGG